MSGKLEAVRNGFRGVEETAGSFHFAMRGRSREDGKAKHGEIHASRSIKIPTTSGLSTEELLGSLRSRLLQYISITYPTVVQVPGTLLGACKEAAAKMWRGIFSRPLSPHSCPVNKNDTHFNCFLCYFKMDTHASTPSHQAIIVA